MLASFKTYTTYVIQNPLKVISRYDSLNECSFSFVKNLKIEIDYKKMLQPFM